MESVGEDLGVALEEQKARKQSLSAAKSVAIISERKTFRTAVLEFLKDKPEAIRHILGVFGDFHGWDNDPSPS